MKTEFTSYKLRFLLRLLELFLVLFQPFAV